MADLIVKILNTGAPKYKVYYRLKDSGNPWGGGAVVNAVSGQYTETSIIGVPSATYEIKIVTICSDESESTDSQFFYSQSCPLPTGLNVYRSGNNFIVQYTLPLTVGRYRLRIEYPNGGEVNSDFVSDQTNQKVIPIPPGVYGDFLFSIASICNPSTVWLSEFLPDVLVTINNPSSCSAPIVSTITLQNEQSLENTYRIWLMGYTSSVKVFVNNTSLNTNFTLTQAVSSGVIDVPLPRSSVPYQYQVTVFNICAVGADEVGDTFSQTVPANV